MDMIIAMLGLLAISLGAILTGPRILENSIRECWPSWKRFERSVSYLKDSHFLPSESKDMFLPFKEYFVDYIKNKEEYSDLKKSPIWKFRLTDSQIVIEDVHGKITPGPNLGEVVKAFRDERRSRMKVIGTILIIVGGILSFVDTIV